MLFTISDDIMSALTTMTSTEGDRIVIGEVHAVTETSPVTTLTGEKDLSVDLH